MLGLIPEQLLRLYLAMLQCFERHQPVTARDNFDRDLGRRGVALDEFLASHALRDQWRDIFGFGYVPGKQKGDDDR